MSILWHIFCKQWRLPGIKTMNEYIFETLVKRSVILQFQVGWSGSAAPEVILKNLDSQKDQGGHFWHFQTRKSD